MATRRKIVFPDGDDATLEMFKGEQLARVGKLGEFTCYPNAPDTAEEYLNRIGDAEAILLGWGLPDDVLVRAPKLELIAFTGVGAANFVNLNIATQNGITVTNTPGYADDTVAEHTMALMLDSVRHVSRLDRDTRKGGWYKGLPGFDLKGRTLGLIGLGGIGSRVSHMAQAFGMRVIAWTRNPSPERAASAGVEFKDLETILSESDVLSLHLALTPDTENMLNAGNFKKLKRGAVLINTARAEIIDETALLSALENGSISAAGLDVFHDEPLPPEHPLRTLENVVLTPHTGFNTPEATSRIMDIAVDSLAAYFSGNPINVIAAPTQQDLRTP